VRLVYVRDFVQVNITVFAAAAPVAAATVAAAARGRGMYFVVWLRAGRAGCVWNCGCAAHAVDVVERPRAGLGAVNVYWRGAASHSPSQSAVVEGICTFG